MGADHDTGRCAPAAGSGEARERPREVVSRPALEQLARCRLYPLERRKALAGSSLAARLFVAWKSRPSDNGAVSFKANQGAWLDSGPRSGQPGRAPVPPFAGRRVRN